MEASSGIGWLTPEAVCSAIEGLKTIGLVAIGAIASYLSAGAARRAEARSARRSLAQALAAEVESYVRIMEVRAHVEAVEAMIPQIKAAPAGAFSVQELLPQLAPMNSKERAEEPNPIFIANLGEVGRLGDVCGDLAQFWAKVRGVRATITNAYEGLYDGTPAARLTPMMEADARLWREAMGMAPGIISRLRAL
ncbi:hypothetical protein [Oricola indica]|uniref:hypothetical protein n=1 Tax=Oricola indica TaxID=2872591 RepID=UPI001CBE46B8|nr:hypothetical protein [Oricola indica]